MCKKQYYRKKVILLSAIIFAIAFIAKMIIWISKIKAVSIDNICKYGFAFSGLLVLIIIIEILLDNKIYFGIAYAWNHYKIIKRLNKQLLDSDFCKQRKHYIDLPKIKLFFNKDLSTGVLKIQNSIRNDRKLDDVLLSSALDSFIVEKHYTTYDNNYYVYELRNTSIPIKQKFNSFDEFLDFNKTIPEYELFLDKRSVVKLQSTLIVGITGSGKTYALYSFLLQMLNKRFDSKVYIADPKDSSLSVIGNKIAKERTAVEIEKIISLLEEFVTSMHKRKVEMKDMLKFRIDGDYSSFNFHPHVFIIDEYASFVAILSSMDKKTKDKVRALLYEIVLQGRQLGFFIFLVTQQAHSNIIETAIRENIPLKIVLGNSEHQTYVTAFGSSVKIPNYNYSVGKGIFTEPTIAPEPKLVECPYFAFDILDSI